jgi:hypothetical protein
MFTLENVSDIEMVFAQLSTFAIRKLLGAVKVTTVGSRIAKTKVNTVGPILLKHLFSCNLNNNLIKLLLFLCFITM